MKKVSFLSVVTTIIRKTYHYYKQRKLTLTFCIKLKEKKAFLFNKNKASKYYNGWKNRAKEQLEVFFDNEYERNH